MNLTYDEFGRPFIVLREQEQKKRLKGIDAIRSHISAARSVANIMKTSLGPCGMDKALVSPDSEVILTNDGATILSEMNLEDPIARLLVQLSRSQDAEVGDGTTGVVVFAGALLEQAEQLLVHGLHPSLIVRGYELALSEARSKIRELATTLEWSLENTKPLEQAVATCIRSKMVARMSAELASIAVRAALSVVDMERRDLHLDLIKVSGKIGGHLEDTMMIDGLLIDKDFSHPQMSPILSDARIAILTCPFEVPKIRTDNKITISTPAQYRELASLERDYFAQMIESVKASGANVVACQWGFDDEANHLLYANDLHAIRWVLGTEIELLSMATGAQIVPRFEELTKEKLGRADRMVEKQFGTTNEKMMVVEGCPFSRAVTILVRGGNKMIVEEAKRAIHDALCMIRTFIRDSRVVFGGGAIDIALSRAVSNSAKNIKGSEQLAYHAYSEALQAIPLALGENSGLPAFETITELNARQQNENRIDIGLDCFQTGNNNMKELNVYEAAHTKEQQISLATQAVRMILKIDDVIKQGSV